jgi:hypothetical protein
MIVKLGSKFYDSNNMPIMIILSDQDKKNISNMSEDAHKYCSFPDNEKLTDDEIRNWMNEV